MNDDVPIFGHVELLYKNSKNNGSSAKDFCIKVNVLSTKFDDNIQAYEIQRRVPQGPNKSQKSNVGWYFPRGESVKNVINGKVKPTF